MYFCNSSDSRRRTSWRAAAICLSKSRGSAKWFAVTLGASLTSAEVASTSPREWVSWWRATNCIILFMMSSTPERKRIPSVARRASVRCSGGTTATDATANSLATLPQPSFSNVRRRLAFAAMTYPTKRGRSLDDQTPKLSRLRSTKFRPTAGRFKTVFTPISRRRASSPTPEICSNWGVRMAPAAKITPLRAWTCASSPNWFSTRTPTARRPSNSMRVTK
mmetsp:Transcript_90264/g.210046  ORF Transcript_90264/g.210046 Transcript_90264/m.210046 type:complete len:221 (-) Transcript_90264:635-1297(-)